MRHAPTATSDLYCVMGHPVEHSRSPWIHTRFAALTHHALQYVARLAPIDGFAADLQAFWAQGGRGCNVTVPFKLEAAELADHCSPRVRLAGAANTLLRQADGQVYADNTDGLGLVADITRNAGVTITDTDVLLIGAGGAAAGVLGPLIEQRPRSITVCNRTAARAQALVARHADVATLHKVQLQAKEQTGLTGNFDLIINGTAASLQGGGIPVPASVLRPGSLAYDMMYGPAAAPFLAWAHAQGALGRDGLGMLVEQAAEAYALWRGVRPPAAQVLQELRAVVDGTVAAAAASPAVTH